MAKIEFQPLQLQTIPLVVQWRKLPHVSKWYGRGESSIELQQKYEKRIDDEVVRPFLIRIDDKPAGYAQYYWASQCGGDWWNDMPDDVAGIDLFIGAPEFFEQGFGKQVIAAFTQHVFAVPGVRRVIADPAPTNARMIHCLKGCGFVNTGPIRTPDGEALLFAKSSV